VGQSALTVGFSRIGEERGILEIMMRVIGDKGEAYDAIGNIIAVLSATRRRPTRSTERQDGGETRD
jgi:hypothetical protein